MNPELEDKLVDQYRQLLRRSWEWCEKYGEKGGPGSYDSAGALCIDIRLHTLMSRFNEPVMHRYHAAAREKDPDAPPDSRSVDAGAPGILRSMSRFHRDISTAFLDEALAQVAALEAHVTSVRDTSLFAGHITKPRNRQHEQSWADETIRELTVLLADYNSQLKPKTSWQREHAQIIPDMGDGRRDWAAEVNKSDRDLSRKAGKLRRLGVPLDEASSEMERRVLNYDAAKLRNLLREYRENILSKSKKEKPAVTQRSGN